MKISTVRNFIKGHIVEEIFEQMMREKEEYDVIPFGYEHTVPMLAQHQHRAEVKEVMDNIKDAPDFVLVSSNKKKVFIVEVKFMANLDQNAAVNYAKKLQKRWAYPWLVVVTLEGFYCGSCDKIEAKGKIRSMTSSWASVERQAEYLKLLREFI